MSLLGYVRLQFLHRASLLLLGLPLLTGCLSFDRREVVPAMVLALLSSPVVIPVSSNPLTEDEGASTTLFRSVTGAARHVSSVHLNQDDAGSILLRSDRRSGSLLHGLDPSLVHPAVRPFLFPSCDVTAVP